MPTTPRYTSTTTINGREFTVDSTPRSYTHARRDAIACLPRFGGGRWMVQPVDGRTVDGTYIPAGTGITRLRRSTDGAVAVILVAPAAA